MNLVARRAAALASRGREASGRRALVAGVAALAVVGAGWAAYAADHPAAWTLYPVDLKVYWDGGLIARHAAPAYDPRLASPLYDWASPTGLKFTYTPFAAATFALVSVVPWRVLPRLSQAVSLVALAAAAWFTMAALGCASRRARAGAALAGMAAGLATEPVFRTLYLGQVNLVLMALILWDLTRAPRPGNRPGDQSGSRPGGRGWAGLATGIAAGIKLTPLVFLPYLLLTRRLREAALAGAGFAATVAVGFAAAPGDSADWWLHGLFFAGGRTGFAGWSGNQSLYGLAIRLAGSVAGATPAWVAAAIVVTVAGLLAAAQLTRAGHPLLGLLAAALVGLLDSPISWDHHWVWVMPAMMAAAGYAARAARGGRRRAAVSWLAVAAGLLLVTFPWPGGLWSVRTTGAGNFTTGLLWAAPDSPVWYYVRHGDQPWFAEYHWRGLQLLAGNAYVLSGLALLAGLVTLAVATRLSGPPGAGVAGRRVARPEAEPVA
ncbi:MAG TPA: glycosyltransferase 87 family protein [Trebonia sp.]|nr:glycosyltransferase 87 family protein [Trebonia sp.]